MTAFCNERKVMFLPHTPSLLDNAAHSEWQCHAFWWAIRQRIIIEYH